MKKHYLIVIFIFGLAGCVNTSGLQPLIEIGKLVSNIAEENEKTKNCEHSRKQDRIDCLKAKQDIVDALNQSIENAKKY
ncbi:MAG: hypothetical protein HRU22_06540 [Gammaproteobacteria bacterium]|nr:hypothetical protein [Gammaproteobacteria bacterium]